MIRCCKVLAMRNFVVRLRGHDTKLASTNERPCRAKYCLSATGGVAYSFFLVHDTTLGYDWRVCKEDHEETEEELLWGKSHLE